MPYPWLKGQRENEYIKQTERCCNFRRKVIFLDDSRSHFQLFLFFDPSASVALATNQVHTVQADILDCINMLALFIFKM